MTPGDPISVLSHGIFVSPGTGDADYPAEGDVRYGVEYDYGALVGTLGTPIAPGASVLDAILSAIVTEHQNASLSIGGQPLTVVKRKLPKKEETVDAAYQVTISGASVPDKITRVSTNTYHVAYAVEMTAISPNEHSALTGLSDNLDWREATRARYMRPRPLPAVPEVKRIEIVPAPFLDRSRLADGYDYQQVALTIWTYETRS